MMSAQDTMAQNVTVQDGVAWRLSSSSNVTVGMGVLLLLAIMLLTFSQATPY